MLSPLAIAAQWLVQRLSSTAEGSAELHGLVLNSAAVLGALQAILEDASSRPGAPGMPRASPGAPSWRGALQETFARAFEIQHTWPAVALVIWQINTTAAGVPVAPAARPMGPAHGAMWSSMGGAGGAAVEAVEAVGGLQLPLLACGALCDIAPMMV